MSEGRGQKRDYSTHKQDHMQHLDGFDYGYGHYDEPGSLRGVIPPLSDADAAARDGDLETILELKSRRIMCSERGANCTVYGGHLHVLRELLKDGIRCSSDVADIAAEKGHSEMVKELRKYGIHCTRSGAVSAARNGHLDIVRDLHNHGIRSDRYGADGAACNGHAEVVRELRSLGIHCTASGADDAARGGHLEIVTDLHAHGISCTVKGADAAACNGHAEVVHELRSLGIHCTASGADDAARGGHLEVVTDLHSHGISCTVKGADEAVLKGHVEVVRELLRQGIRCTEHAANDAARCGYLHVLKELGNHGVFCTWKGYCEAYERKHEHVLEELRLPLRSYHRLLQAPEAQRLCVAVDVDNTLVSVATFDMGLATGRAEELNELGLEIVSTSETERKGQPIIKYEVLRPGAREFLASISEFADVVLMTNRSAESAVEAQKMLDPDNKIFAAVVNVSCASPFTTYRVVKDLHVIRKDLRRVVLVDDMWMRVGRYQITNCLPIRYWLPQAKHNETTYVPDMLTDNELLGNILPMLQQRLAEAPDVRDELAKHLSGTQFSKQIKFLVSTLWSYQVREHPALQQAADQRKHILETRALETLSSSEISTIVSSAHLYTDECLSKIRSYSDGQIVM